MTTMTELQARLTRIRALIAGLEEQEGELARVKKPTATVQRRRLEISCDLSHRRRIEAEIRIEALAAEVGERRATVIAARAAGGDGEREAKALEEAERALADRHILLEPEVLTAQHELERRAWSAHVRDHGPAMLEEGRARGDAINAVVRDVRARLVDAEARWKALDQELHWSVRGEYRSGSA